MAVKLYPHQEKAVEQLDNGKILWGGVGTGKTLTALAYFYIKILGGSKGGSGDIHMYSDLYVITTAKKRDSLDWEREAAKFSISRDRDASIGGIQLTVDSWNNIDKYRDVQDAFFIFDEQRLVGSGAWTKAFIKIAQGNRWVLLSATPGDTWMDYIPVFIANGFYKNRTEFKRRHVVYNTFSKFPKVERYLEVGHLLKLRRSILVAMPYVRHTTRHLVQVPVEYDKDLVDTVVKKRWHPYESRPFQNVAELFYTLRKVTNSSSSRCDAIRAIMNAHPRLIIFYNFDYELEMLREMAKEMTGVETAEWNGHLHQEIPSSDRWLYFVQYIAGAEAWETTETDAVIFFSLTYSYKNFEQAQGRIDRLSTPFSDLYYYILLSDSVIDKAVMRSLRAKRSFNESEVTLHTYV